MYASLPHKETMRLILFDMVLCEILEMSEVSCNKFGVLRKCESRKSLVLARSKFVIFFDAIYKRTLNILWQVHKMAQGRV